MPLPIQNEGTDEDIVLMGGGEIEGIFTAEGEDASALYCFWTPTRIVAILVLLVDVGGYAVCVYFAHQRRKKIKALRGEQEEDSTNTSSTTGGGGDIPIFWFGHDNQLFDGEVRDEWRKKCFCVCVWHQEIQSGMMLRGARIWIYANIEG
jgi:hypothetical protein